MVWDQASVALASTGLTATDISNSQLHEYTSMSRQALVSYSRREVWKLKERFAGWMGSIIFAAPCDLHAGSGIAVTMQLESTDSELCPSPFPSSSNEEQER